MRLWSIHPKYLDRVGLVALWREALLAKKVLQGRTKGYRHHPQLVRFKEQPRPLAAVSSYLYHVWLEAKKRGFDFDRAKIGRRCRASKIPVTRSQLGYEFALLCYKLKGRDDCSRKKLLGEKRIAPNPVFRAIPGAIETWEKIKVSRPS